MTTPDGDRTRAPSLSSDGKRGRILTEAARLFASNGYGSTSLNDLARQVGIAKPTLFHYFSSKQEILFALYRHTMEVSFARMKELAADDLDPIEAVRARVREHALMILENRELFTILFDEEGELSPEQREVILAQQRDYIHVIAADVREVGRLGGDDAVVSTNIAVQGLLGMASWVYRWYDPAGPYDKERVASMLAELAVTGVRGVRVEG